MKSVPAFYLSVELLVPKALQPQKTPKWGILAPSELSQPIPLILPPGTELLELLGEAQSSSFAAQQLQYLCCSHQSPGSKLRYFRGGFKEAAGCSAKWPRCLWCNHLSQLFSQTCFVKIIEISFDLQRHKFSSLLSYLPCAGWHEQHANNYRGSFKDLRNAVFCLKTLSRPQKGLPIRQATTAKTWDKHRRNYRPIRWQHLTLRILYLKFL